MSPFIQAWLGVLAVSLVLGRSSHQESIPASIHTDILRISRSSRGTSSLIHVTEKEIQADERRPKLKKVRRKARFPRKSYGGGYTPRRRYSSRQKPARSYLGPSSAPATQSQEYQEPSKSTESSYGAPPSYTTPRSSFTSPRPYYTSPSPSSATFTSPGPYKPYQSFPQKYEQKTHTTASPIYSSPSPKSFYKASKTSYQAIKPSYQTPKPSYLAPKPSYSAPKPSYTAPQPSYSAPKPTHSAPKPSYSVPKPSYSAPKPSYSAPNPSYLAPKSSYSAPKPSYSAPKPSYSAPKPAYSAPKPSYSAPKPSYSAPKPSYSVPRPSYSAPKPSYSAPNPSYSVPTPSYPHTSIKGQDESGSSEYEYHYDVTDKEQYGPVFSAWEKRSGYSTQGEYRVTLPDGRVQVVSYVADQGRGYVADVSYQGEPTPPAAHHPVTQPPASHQYSPSADSNFYG